MKAAIFLLAAALGSASPVQTRNSVQARDGQNACDCSKPFEVYVSELDRCPAGYDDISATWIPHCVQTGCSAQDHKAQCDAKAQDAKAGCDAKPQDTTPTNVVVQPAKTTTASSEQKSCDCSKPLRASISEVESCPAGYKNIAVTWIPDCIQIGCSDEDYKSQCDAKSQDAAPTTVVALPANTTTASSKQKSCDCSKPLKASVSEVESCPAGYNNIAVTWIPDCIQSGCSDEDYKAQCDANPQDAAPTTAVAQPANTATASSDKKSCDCSKPLTANISEVESCPAGYKNIAVTWIPNCVQIGCSAEDYKAQCDANAQDAKPAANACT